MPQRLEWVNTLKGIGILFVVVGHLNTPLSKFIFSWHMPLFFFISGFFIDPQSEAKDHLVKNLKRLMIPYLLFGTFGILVEIFKRFLLGREPINISIVLKGFLFDMDAAGLEGHYGFLLWFLPTLFIGKCLLQFILLKQINYYLIALLCLVFFGVSLSVEIPLAIDNAFGSIIWIFFGYVFFRKFSEIKFNRVEILLPIFIITILILLSPIGVIKLDVASETYGNVPMNFIWATLMIILFIGISQLRFTQNKYFNVIRTLGEQSLFIYVIHPYTNNISYLLGKNDHWIVYTSLAVLFACIIAAAKKLLPKWRVLNYV